MTLVADDAAKARAGTLTMATQMPSRMAETERAKAAAA